MDAAAMKLIYQNLACGVPPEQQARALGCDVEEVNRTFRHVGLVMANLQLTETMPYVPCQTQISAMQNRKRVLQLLDDLDLTVVPIYHKVRAARCAVEN